MLSDYFGDEMHNGILRIFLVYIRSLSSILSTYWLFTSKINKCNYGKTLETICVCFLRIQIKISDTHQLCCPAALHCACMVAEYRRYPWSKYFTFKSSFFNALTQTPANASATLHMHFPNAKVPINPPKTNHQTNANRIATHTLCQRVDRARP